jgi:transcriptional regulator with XRE-family HTH domain
MTAIGESIKRIRLELGISQNKFSKIIGVSRVTVTNVEAGKKNFSLGTLVKVASKLGTTPNDLMGITVPTAQE